MFKNGVKGSDVMWSEASDMTWREVKWSEVKRSEMKVFVEWV